MKKMLQIFVAYPNLIRSIKKLIEFDENTSGETVKIPRCENWRFESYESTINPELRFMVDMDIAGCSWIELPAEKFYPRHVNTHETSCQQEVDIWYFSSDLIRVFKRILLKPSIFYRKHKMTVYSLNTLVLTINILFFRHPHPREKIRASKWGARLIKNQCEA